MRLITMAVLAVVVAGCAANNGAQPPGQTPAAGQTQATGQTQAAGQTQATPANAPRKVKSMDGSFDGEMVGTPAPGSKFARVQIGMHLRQVEDLIGRADDTDSHITGKQFIPFYFGGDMHRLEAFYKGEGVLTFSPEHLGGDANRLIKITVDPSETGYAH